jgi:hypothetical protein
VRIPKFNPKGAKPWMLKFPLLVRLYLLALFPFAPFIYAAVILWENRKDFSELSVMTKAIFLPWEQKP